MNVELERVLVGLQRILPHHALSRLVYFATRCRFEPWKNFLIRQISQKFEIDMDEAKSANLDDYANFADFFTRELKPGVRPIDQDKNSVISPADGVVSDFGKIMSDSLIHAKGHNYGLPQLLAESEDVDRYRHGQHATIYLSPKDYHRVHMPFSGRLIKTVYIPGRLFSVAPYTVKHIPGLLAKNERLVCHFETEKGPMAVILVGAMLVSAIETVWQGMITPRFDKVLNVRHYGGKNQQQVYLNKGDELGRFNMGSTVILLFGEQMVNWDDSLKTEPTVKVGESIARI